MSLRANTIHIRPSATGLVSVDKARNELRVPVPSSHFMIPDYEIVLVYFKKVFFGSDTEEEGTARQAN